MGIFMPIVVVFLVPVVPPILGSMLTPIFTLRVETAQGEAQQGQADGQGDKAFHVGLRVGSGDG
jgi:hypothetical protein